MILPMVVKKALDYLAQPSIRHKMGIPDDNKFLFAIPSHLSAIKGYDVLRKFGLQFGLTKPKAFTGNALRKYLATTIQVLNLGGTELNQVAKHFGHDIEVHHSYYRQHDELIEKSTIAKLLLLSEQGKIHTQVSTNSKVNVLRDSDKLLVTPNQTLNISIFF
jgi:hypothetical protein